MTRVPAPIESAAGNALQKLVIGLTGGIGSGKSTVAEMFKELGVAVIDSDTISHQLTQAGGAAMGPIGGVFGEGFLTTSGALDRAKMRRLVFSDAGARKRLEAILHPLIRTQILAEAEAARSSP